MLPTLRLSPIPPLPFSMSCFGPFHHHFFPSFLFCVINSIYVRSPSCLPFWPAAAPFSVAQYYSLSLSFTYIFVSRLYIYIYINIYMYIYTYREKKERK